MNILINKTYLFFFLVIPVILAVSLYHPEEIFDLNIYDTYYIIQHSHLGILLSILYFIMGLIYLFLHQKRIHLAHWIVYCDSIVSIGGLVLIWLIFKKINYIPQNFEETIRVIEVNYYLEKICFIILMSIILIKIIFTTHVIFKIIKNNPFREDF